MVLAAFVAGSPAPASARTGIERRPAAWANYSHRQRPASAIRMVVLHVTESSYDGAVSWFRNGRAHVSAHYVVGRDGRIAHMVPDRLEAWHAGNAWVNAHSIGIEHAGLVGVPGIFRTRSTAPAPVSSRSSSAATGSPPTAAT